MTFNVTFRQYFQVLVYYFTVNFFAFFLEDSTDQELI